MTGAIAEPETPKRLTPTATVTRDLYLRSGNRCAYRGCAQALMTADGVLVGEIAHIEAAMPEGKRFRAAMTNEQRRAFSNLLLLCGTHHTVIDTDDQTWTVEELQKLKDEHEAVYTGAIDRLRSTVADVTEGVAWVSATNLRRLSHVQTLTEDEIQVDIGVLDDLGSRLAAIPVGARSVLALIVSRGDTSRGRWDDEVSIPIPVLEQLADCPKEELREYLAVLEHYRLAWLDDEDLPTQIIVGNSTPTIGWPVLADLKNLVESDAGEVRRLLVDLDFTVFDAAEPDL